jgi:hypothetical protein
VDTILFHVGARKSQQVAAAQAGPAGESRMTEEIKDICALCKHFKMKDHPQHAAVGIGRCRGYDGDPFTKLKNPFIPWGMKKCARFAQDYAGTVKRVEWVEKQLAKQIPTITIPAPRRVATTHGGI